ncbi:unnamed protein product [Prorocentrum cordatum]|uniref:Altered inheritance of mitochondria protein 24, mitochondrial n=1 Tax=Prorocentrum cordatum TaxID=2364126 RepID=A0ABN9SVA3_9DINO|nr:unnamed protein product [Polarella glacialis]
MLSLTWGCASARRFWRGGAPPQLDPVRKTSTASSFLPMPTERMRELRSLARRFEVVTPPQGSPFGVPEGAGETTQQQQQQQQQRRLLNLLTPDGVGNQSITLSAGATLTYLDGPPCYAPRNISGAWISAVMPPDSMFVSSTAAGTGTPRRAAAEPRPKAWLGSTAGAIQRRAAQRKRLRNVRGIRV